MTLQHLHDITTSSKFDSFEISLLGSDNV